MLNVLLVECGVDSASLEKALNLDDISILKIQYSASLLAHVKESRPDFVIINVDTLPEKLISDLCTLNQQLPLPVILFANDGSSGTIDKVIKAEVSAYIVDGLPYHRLSSLILVAMARFKQTQSLKNALEEARTQLEDRKQIDRAKAILIKTQHFTEDVAYHTLRKLAMDRNITLGEMARNVIAMAELLK
jgi:two-component system, response regulator / RNA-binding antiterminator